MFHAHDKEVFNFTDDFINKIEELFAESQEAAFPNLHSGWRLAVDVYEHTDSLLFVAEVAGIRRQDISVTVTERSVNFSGYRNPTCSKIQGFYHRMEIPTGHFCRKFSLPVNVEPDQGQAKVIDGMLYLLLPKKKC
jgi:HSP20 family protein